MLIAFEGLDQSGKETQVRRLASQFEAAGQRGRHPDVPLLSDRDRPGDRAGASGRTPVPADVLQLLYIANRYEYRAQIAGWLGEGRPVLCDRYLASSVAYGEAAASTPTGCSTCSAICRSRT